MIRELVIHNFGAIKSADISLKDFNILIGEQGAGKSTIAKLITIFENYRTSLIQGNKYDFALRFEEFNIASYFNKDTYINYSGEKVSIRFKDGEFTIEIPEASTSNNTPQNLYIPAERFFVSTFSRSLATLVLTKAPIPNVLLEFASFYEKAKNRFPTYNVPILNLQFQANEVSESLLLKDFNKIIPFKDASSGIQSVIPLLMVLDYAKKETAYNQFVVEEPELNLFPQTQVDLLHLMVSKSPCLTVTTHSPYLLSALNNMIEASNVLKAHPDKKEEVVQLIPENCILDYDNVTAYKIEEGNVVSILDAEYRLIVADKIDVISDQESRIFSALLDLE